MNLNLVESATLEFKAPVDTNLVLTEAEDDTRVVMAWESGNFSRSDISSLDWIEAEHRKFVGLAPTIIHQRRENDLFPVLVAWVNPADNRIHITYGNSIRRMFSPGFALFQTTNYQPALLGFQNKRYLLWWESPDLKIAEYLGQGVLLNSNTIFTSTGFGNINGAFQPSVAVLEKSAYERSSDEVFVLDQLGAISKGSSVLHVNRSTDLIHWQFSLLRLPRAIAPRPVIVSFKDRLFIFYTGFVPNNTVRYVSSTDGITWTAEQDLPVDTSVDPSGLASVAGGIGVARHFDRLVVVWITGQHSTSPDDILISVYS
jgi:hypothetical protein